MLLASLHILSLPITMHVYPFFPARRVCMLPLDSMRTPAAPLATAAGPGAGAWVIYSEADTRCCWALAVAAVKQIEIASVRIVERKRMCSSIRLERDSV